MKESSSNQSVLRGVLTGTLWVNASVFGGKLLVLLATAILARLLSHEDFGVAGYALVMIGLLDVFTGVGVAPALIYHRDKPRVADTAFVLSVISGCVLFAVGWCVAPAAAFFFRDPRATSVTRVLALTFPIAALAEIHDARLSKGLHFARKFIPDITKASVKGFSVVAFALGGFGAWSLIFGQLAGTVAFAIACWMVHPWRPSWRFDTKAAKALTSYGVNIVAVNALGVLLLNSDYLLIGRYLGAAALGVYTMAFRLPELLIKQFSQTVSRVLFPTYSAVRKNSTDLKQTFVDTTRLVVLVTLPIGVGLALVARPLVIVIFSEKWIEAVPVLRLVALYMLMRSLTFNTGDVYKAQGRPRVLLQLSTLRLCVLIPALFWATTRVGSLTAIAGVHLVVATLGSALNIVVASRLLLVPVRTILSAYRPAFVAGTGMCLVVAFLVQMLGGASPIVLLLVSVIAGIVAYLLLLQWVAPETLALVVSLVKRPPRKQGAGDAEILEIDEEKGVQPDA